MGRERLGASVTNCPAERSEADGRNGCTHEENRRAREQFQESQQLAEELSVIAVYLVEDERAQGERWKAEKGALVVLHKSQHRIHCAGDDLLSPCMQGVGPDRDFLPLFSRRLKFLKIDLRAPVHHHPLQPGLTEKVVSEARRCRAGRRISKKELAPYGPPLSPHVGGSCLAVSGACSNDRRGTGGPNIPLKVARELAG